jgi:hypothetical protein
MPMMQHSTQMKTTMPWCFGHMAIPIIRCLAAEKAWCESSLQGDAFLKSSLMKMLPWRTYFQSKTPMFQEVP